MNYEDSLYMWIHLILMLLYIQACIQAEYEVTVSRDTTEHHLDQIIYCKAKVRQLNNTGYEEYIREKKLKTH